MANPRHLYLVDERTDKVVKRWQVEDLSEAQITKLEREILAQAGEDVVLRDSKFD